MFVAKVMRNPSGPAQTADLMLAIHLAGIINMMQVFIVQIEVCYFLVFALAVFEECLKVLLFSSGYHVKV